MKQEYDKLEMAIIILFAAIVLISFTGCTIIKIREPIDLSKIQEFQKK
tara:strand:- start:2437 stop:2580 length:144 start_codon:yes stop_codon:yes gene_type:complete